MRAHAGQIFRAAFSPKEDSIVTAGDDGVARIWAVPSGKLVSELKGHTHRLLNAEFSPDGRYILTAASPWPVSEEVAAEERRGTITSGPLAGGRELGTPEPDNSVRLWNLTTGEVVAIQPPMETMVGAGFAPSGQFVWVNWNGYAMLYDLKGNRIGNGFTGRLASFSFDGSLFATIEFNSTVRVRRTEDYAIVSVLPGEFAKFSQDGRRILTANPDGSASIWSLDEDRDRDGLRKSTEDRLSISFSRNGAMVATMDYGETTRVWSGDTGTDLTSKS
jgi:WD40 repeat protein